MLMYGKNMMPIEDPPRALRQDEVDQPAFAKRFQLRKRLLDTFWRKWQKEYLSRYEVNRTWRQKHENALRVGDVVVLIDPDKLKKTDWKLGRVVEPTFFATTGELSGAKCRLANGQVVTRHLRQLALLEADTSFRGKLVEIRPPSHDDSSVTVTRLDKSPEDRPHTTPTERVSPKKSLSHDADGHDRASGRPSVTEPPAKKVLKVQSTTYGEETIKDLRSNESPDNATPTSRTDMVDTTLPAKIVPVVAGDEESVELIGVDARPPQSDVRASVSDGHAAGGSMLETGEIDVARETISAPSSEHNLRTRTRKRKIHRSNRLHVKKNDTADQKGP